MPLEFVPTFPSAARQPALGFALDPALANQAPGAEEAVEAPATAKCVEAIGGRSLELFPAAGIATMMSGTAAEQLRSEGEGSM
jgi:hypothetical protein